MRVLAGLQDFPCVPALNKLRLATVAAGDLLDYSSRVRDMLAKHHVLSRSLGTRAIGTFSEREEHFGEPRNLRKLHLRLENWEILSRSLR